MTNTQEQQPKPPLYGETAAAEPREGIVRRCT